MTATRRSLRSSASTTSLPPRLPSSTSNIHHDSPTTSRRASHSKQEPSLAELIRAEQDWDNAAAPTRSHAIEAAPFAADVTNDATKPHARRRSSAPLPDLPPDATEELAPQAMPPFAVHPLPPVPPLLLPPHYGKPIRPSSPDAFAALFRPVLRSLSRPASPSVSRSTSSLDLLHRTRDNSSSSDSLPSVPARGEKSGTEPATIITSAPIDRSSSSLPAQFPPREPTDPAPTVESQGFVLYIGSLVAYVMYLVWAFLPEQWLVAIGIEWYPSRDWALLVPAWIVMLVAFVYISYFLLTMYSTPSLALSEPYNDPRAYVPPPPRPKLGKDGQPRPPTPLWAHAVLLPEEAIPPLYDLPIEVVERVLYGSSDDDVDDNPEVDEGDKGEEG
ncbi:hypothetical protein JCM8115_002896 [Rhodotorula mucilaginosa]